MTSLLLAALLACSSGSVGTDSGGSDSGGSDGGGSDGGATDGGADGGSSDGGSSDGGSDGGADGGSGDGGADGGSGDGGSGDGGTTTPFDDIQAVVHDDIGSLITVSWVQVVAADVRVEFRVSGEDWRSSPVQAVETGEVEQLLLGMPYGVEVEYRVASDAGDGDVLSDPATISTDPAPATLPLAALLAEDTTLQDPDTNYVFTVVDGPAFGYDDVWSFIVDRQGRPVWAWKTIDYRTTLHPRVSHDGTELLVDYNSYWSIYDGGADSQVARLHLDGTVVEVVDTPGMHHPFTDLADGSLVYGSAVSSAGEDLVQVSPDGSSTTLWSCLDWRNDNGIGGYCGSNTIWWDEDTDHILYSFYSVETVVELDRDSGETLRWFGHAAGAWSFDATASAFWWQHGAHLTDDGNLLLSSKNRDDGDETVFREYRLDEDAETLTLITSVGDGDGIYGDVLGEAWRLDNGNTLHNTGSAPRLRELTPTGEVAWDVAWEGGYIGRSTPIADLYDLAH